MLKRCFKLNGEMNNKCKFLYINTKQTNNFYKLILQTEILINEGSLLRYPPICYGSESEVHMPNSTQVYQAYTGSDLRPCSAEDKTQGTTDTSYAFYY